jgi:hypothetical protein
MNQSGHLVGKIARVTATVGSNRIGEVMLAVRGGTEAFNAYARTDVSYAVGERVVVVEYHPPRTVVVDRA